MVRAALAMAVLIACSAAGGGFGCAGGGGSGDDAGIDTLPPPPECEAIEWVEPPGCGTEAGAWESMIPGAGEPAFDGELATKASRIERQFHAFNAHGTGANADIAVALDRTEERTLLESFVRETDGWDFEAWSGRPVEDVVTEWQKVAGLYAGAGIAADAFRYGVLRDRGASCDEVDVAREHVIRDLDVLHMATAITGVEGVIARGFMRTNLPGVIPETTPLFDPDGNPLPEVKNNGTWRDDASGGLYPGWIWEDSCSRDMLIGWVLGMVSAYEVVRDDPTVPQQMKDTLAADATAIARSLMTVRANGFDLEIWDADGRRTYHGVMHEEAFDRIYLPPSKNGMYAIMSLGIVAALAHIAGEPDIDAYLWQQLVYRRELHVHARDQMGIVDFGAKSNFSNYNMAFIGGWLAHRYLCDEEVRAVVRDAVWTGLYERPGRSRQPAEQAQTFYDFVYAAARAGASAWGPMGSDAGVDPDVYTDEESIARGTVTLTGFAEPPTWDVGRLNCDETEIAALTCTFVDGTEILLMGYEGRDDALVAAEPVPMRVRPLSNYFWRSDPYSVNGEGDGSRLLPASDFRIAYWMALWIRR